MIMGSIIRVHFFYKLPLSRLFEDQSWSQHRWIKSCEFFGRSHGKFYVYVPLALCSSIRITLSFHFNWFKGTVLISKMIWVLISRLSWEWDPSPDIQFFEEIDKVDLFSINFLRVQIHFMKDEKRICVFFYDFMCKKLTTSWLDNGHHKKLLQHESTINYKEILLIDCPTFS